MFQCPPPPVPLPVWISPCLEDEVTCALPDLDQDGIVGIADLLDLFSLWGPADCTVFKRGDINMDGEVDVVDMLILVAAWDGNYDPATWNRCNCE